ncbi:MAG: hypothetical protein NT169_01810 [Chloroflexi bacterium]|nr:hypothetical protein [Chloroflexota bacterium]
MHYFSTSMVVWMAIVACLMLGSLVWNLTHRRNARPAARVAPARVAPVAAPASRPVVRPAARIAPVAVAPVVAPVAASVAAPRRQPRARGPLGPTLGAQYRQQLIAAGRIIPADTQMPEPVPAPDPVSALDFTI